MPFRITDLPFAEACRVIDRWGEALHKASLAGQPWPSIDEERFRLEPKPVLRFTDVIVAFVLNAAGFALALFVVQFCTFVVNHH